MIKINNIYNVRVRKTACACLSALMCLFALSTTAQAKKDLWPDGTPMADWFKNTKKVDVNTLGKQYVITD